jgi:dihydroorotate dehydrogenase
VSAIIATNTTTDHAGVSAKTDQPGGLSGAPLHAKSTEVIRIVSSQCEIPIIGCGGVMDAASAREKFEAGASLVQIYTGLIYRGPGLLTDIGQGTSSGKQHSP